MRAAVGALLLLAADAAAAEVPLRLQADLVFYGDNTEFRNPYREGDTTFGAHGRVYFSAKPAEKVEVRLGLFGNQRFGSEDAFEEWRPVLSVHIGTETSRFILGTLETNLRPGPGPDLEGPHRLIPPLQVEVLGFTRPYEAGLQWTGKRDRLEHDAWLAWRALNTPSQREVFDTGARVRGRVAGPLWLALQVHEVHHGGQLFASGAVRDSVAVAYGVHVEPALVALSRASFELYGLYAVDDPDRAAAGRNQGRGVFARAAAEKKGFRAHAILFRGSDYVKDEGDPNTLSRTQAGRPVEETRRYEEVGLARVFALAPEAEVEASGRLHWVDGRRGYSYRVLASVRFGWPVRPRPQEP